MVGVDQASFPLLSDLGGLLPDTLYNVGTYLKESKTSDETLKS